ncbi:hypothetical protein MYSTI_07144 [Myxococcus stipitatus DSM 14675]|uniref:Uncharacterized protein n=1 Tax=Myxococcus stipitatus (strain DSM 14675 / JCM 12634 / Mx s8) TaxID=1278073 RepID=L7UHG3_MYXSD|nr:hypothetical protein MYSTI_07144 [Myxococcus stipitatus DSM 14675]
MRAHVGARTAPASPTPRSRWVSTGEGSLAQALLMRCSPRDDRAARLEEHRMNTQTESFYDTVLFALGPVVVGYGFAMVALLVTYARP